MCIRDSFIPEYKGMSSFPGRIMHSHDFRDAEEFRGKNIIVLGSSYSAEDIALQCNKYGAKSVTIGYRHNPMGFKWPEGMKEVFYLDRLEGKKAIFKDGTEQDADVIMGKINMPSGEEIDKDINKWVALEEKLENPDQMIDFQTEYTKELHEMSDYPKIDFELIRKHFKEWEHHKAVSYTHLTLPTTLSV